MTDGMNIDFPSLSLSEDEEYVTFLTQVINDIYDVAEAGLFIETHKRTDEAEVSKLMKDRQLALARVQTGESEQDRLLGCVRVVMFDAMTGLVGTLCARPSIKGTGLGRKLVNFAEQECRRQGAREMRLELLVPSTYENANKVWLQAWYERMGYVLKETKEVKEILPGLVDDLATPVEIRVLQKTLQT